MNKFRALILFILVFILPFQLGKHFWPPFAVVKGFHLDLLSPVIYLTDILIFIYLVLNFTSLRSALMKLKPSVYVPVFTLILINIVTSLSPLASILTWFRWLIYFFLLITLIMEKNLLKKIRLPFLISLFFVCLIAFFQFIFQHSVGDLFYLLGERPLSPLLPQIAKFSLPSGQLVLRPYATFSHPNSLAGFLLVALLILTQIRSGFVLKYLKLLVLLTIIITFSKSALLALVIFLSFPFLPLFVISLLVSLLPLFSSFVSFPVWLGVSVISRLNFGRTALLMIKDHLIFGVGLNNYLIGLASYLPAFQISYSSLQPIHSLPLLFLAEFGLSGVIVLTYLIRKLGPLYGSLPSDKKNLLKKTMLLVIITGSVDHYWWTLPQNKLILVLILAIIFNKAYDKHQIRHN